MYKSLKVKDDIYWVGALDYDIKFFDIIMYTKYGTTYNSFIVKGDDKTALIDVCKEGFFDEFLERLKDSIDPSLIDYIILNHTEPDHSGNLSRLLEVCPNAKIFGTGPGIKFVKEIVNREIDSVIVKDGDSLDLGGKTLKFIMAPFLHWPDTMYTYIPELKTIFTCDSFGCHYCDEKIFSDKIEGDFSEAYKYYFDCLMSPFKSYVISALDKIKDLDIETICTGHGPVIRENPKKYLDMYREWATVKKPEKQSVVIAYATAYGYTKKLADEISNGIQSVSDIDVHLFDVVFSDTKTIIEKIPDTDGILIGSTTILADTLPPIRHILAELNSIIHKGKIVGVFGSYGWSGEAISNIEQRFNQLKLKQPLPALKVNFNPKNTQLEEAFQFGKSFGEEILKLK